jgi:hypothetical protein
MADKCLLTILIHHLRHNTSWELLLQEHHSNIVSTIFNLRRVYEKHETEYNSYQVVLLNVVLIQGVH